MAKKTKNWWIKVEQYDHGDLYELITTTKYYVYHKSSEKPVYVFKGETEAELGNGLWESSGVSGVKNVELFENEGYVLVTYYGSKKSQKFPLEVPQKDK